MLSPSRKNWHCGILVTKIFMSHCLMFILLMTVYTTWKWKVLSTFRIYMLPPYRGAKLIMWVNIHKCIDFGSTDAFGGVLSLRPIGPYWGPATTFPLLCLLKQNLYTRVLTYLTPLEPCISETSTLSSTSTLCRNPRSTIIISNGTLWEQNISILSWKCK
jgi:hypothetical protein